jgi:hypothetical protein
VFPFEILDNAVTVNESFQLYRIFSNHFRNMSDSSFNVVPREKVDELINTEMEFQLSNFSAQNKTAEMMQVENATQVVSGVIGKAGNMINIVVTLYTYPKLEHLPGGADRRVANVPQLFDIIPELVQSMQNEISGRGTAPVIQEPILSLYEQLVNAAGVTTITVTHDTPFQGAVISHASSIVLRGDMTGRMVFGSPVENTYRIIVERGVSLTLENITLKGICVEINEGGTLIMKNSSVITGCGVYGVLCKGTFTMNGGSITDNGGRGVIVNGIFIMSVGNITNNGGGVLIEGGTFTMNGGNINNNGGNGVQIEKGGTFNMNDGRIVNHNGGYGGGVFLVGTGTFTMKNGRIENNQGYNAGGVEVRDGCRFYMYGGVIAGNISENGGGGIHISRGGTFIMTGGTVYGSNGGSNANRGRWGDAVSDANKYINNINRTIYRHDSTKYF